MKNNNYTSWLVPLDIAKELKEIGFDCPCPFILSNIDEIIISSEVYIDESQSGLIDIETTIDNDLNFVNNEDILVIPTYEQVLAWFRAKGYKITFKDINIGTQCAFYHLDIKEGHTFSHFAKKYEKAREGLVMKLIEVHKEFGNNIKRFD